MGFEKIRRYILRNIARKDTHFMVNCAKLAYEGKVGATT